MEPETIEMLLAASFDYQAEVTVCRIRQFWVNLYVDSTPEIKEPVLFEGDALRLQIAGMDRIKHCVWNKLYQAELFADVRFPEGKIYEDVSTVYKVLMKAERVVLLPDVLLHYRKRMSSLTNSNTVNHPVDLWNAFYLKYTDLYAAGLTEDAARVLLKLCFYHAERIWLNYYGFTKDEKRQLAETTKSIRSFCFRHIKKILSDKQVNATIRLLSPFLLLRDPVIYYILYQWKRLHDRKKPDEGRLYP